MTFQKIYIRSQLRSVADPGVWYGEGPKIYFNKELIIKIISLNYNLKKREFRSKECSFFNPFLNTFF